jgi:hypothetical protein
MLEAILSKYLLNALPEMGDSLEEVNRDIS